MQLGSDHLKFTRPMFQVAEKAKIACSSFAFGEVELRFESCDRGWLSFLHQRYRGFEVPFRAGAFAIRFEPTSTAIPPDLVSPLAPRLECVHCTRTGEGYRVRTDTSDGEVDLSARRALLRGPSAMYPLDNLLRYLLPLLWEGLIAHAALVEDGAGRGFLACGPSGAGKSTIARLARSRACSDELTAVRSSGRQLESVALPFWNARPGSFPLRAVLHLRHADGHRLARISPEESLRRLASQTLWPVWSEKAMNRVFGCLADLSTRVPAYELSFAPEDDVWSFVDEAAS
jgi:hypothetical protein